MSLSARTCCAGQTRRPRAHLRIEILRKKATYKPKKNPFMRVASLPPETSSFQMQIQASHHRDSYAGAVLGVVNALRCASTRPTAGPAGIDDASARHPFGNCAMVVSVMTARTRLTRTTRGRMVGSSPQCRTALLRFATTASGARIPPTAPRARSGAHPSQHRSLLQDHRSAVDLHTVGCELHGFWRRRVLRTTRRNEAAFTRA